jgi:hypothetical protein
MGPGPRTAAQFPKRLQQKFRGRRFAPLDPPDFLDYEGAQLVFIGAAENAKKELGIDSARITKPGTPPMSSRT